MPGAIGTTCPYCSAPLVRMQLDEAFFDHPWDLACFNDGCPYYVRGWTWMEQQYGVAVSYRYRIDPNTGQDSPVPVWSASALRSSILPDEAAPTAAKEHP